MRLETAARNENVVQKQLFVKRKILCMYMYIDTNYQNQHIFHLVLLMYYIQ